MTEANYFSRLNKDHFVYEDGTVRVNYPAPPRPWWSLPAAEPTAFASPSPFAPASMPPKPAPTMSSTSTPSLRRWKSANSSPACGGRTARHLSTFPTSARKQPPPHPLRRREADQQATPQHQPSRLYTHTHTLSLSLSLSLSLGFRCHHSVYRVLIIIYFQVVYKIIFC